jgi:general secretion pathway protein M
MWRVSKPMRRMAALALLAAAFAAVVFGIAMPIVYRINGLARSLDDQQWQLEQYTAVAVREASVRTLEQRQQAELALGEFLAGDSELAARASLQTVLTGFAQSNGVRIRSARKLPDRERAGFNLIGIGIDLTTDIENLQKLLYAIETTRPYFLVESADISPLGGANPAPGEAPLLEVRLHIFAAQRRRD